MSPSLWGFLDLKPEIFHVVFWEFPFLDVKPFKEFSQALLGNLGPGLFLRVSCKHSYRSYCIYWCPKRPCFASSFKFFFLKDSFVLK